ncbi:MAG: hypothetical protein II198_06730 [Bacteroidaceae bacterium]|jgi:hypothetical protein|nr:hypothetical protein [Bacteroidaceae bacterium]
MPHRYDIYSSLSDQELIERLTATPVDEKLHNYFFTKKCRQFLRYISSNIYHCESETELWGEFYEFLSKDNWAVVRNWKNRNGATLYTYLAYCTTNHFIHKKMAEKKEQEQLFVPSSQNMYEQLAGFVEEEEEVHIYPVREAFNMLNPRDQVILRMLVIDGSSALDAAPVIWKYIKNNKPLEEMDPKRVQCTIAMAKHRAQLALLNNLKQISKL